MRDSFDPWLTFFVAALATWRVTHLLAAEDGPFDLLARARGRLGRSALGQLFDCFHCLSVWVAAPFALLLYPRWPDALLAWLGLSGAACLLERLGAQRVEIAPLPPEEGS